MAALKEKKPYLFNSQTSTTRTEDAPKPGKKVEAKKASEMTPEEYEAAKRELLGRKK